MLINLLDSILYDCMKKKLVLIGLALLIVAVVLFILSGYLLTKGFAGNISFTNLTVSAHNFSYAPVTYNRSTSAVAVYAVISSPTNLYLLNGSMFVRWYGYMSANKSAVSGYEYAQRIDSNSVYLFKNTSFELIPLNLKVAPIANNSSGRLYVVVDNTKGSKSYDTHANATISYVPLNTSTVLLSAGLGYGVLILGIAGIIIIIWGLLKKDGETKKGNKTGKNEVSEDQKAYLDQLYKGVKKGKG